MKVVPVPFSTEVKNMLIHTKELLEFETPILAINPNFDKLTTSLRTAISDDLGKLDKEGTSYDNVLDAFRLSFETFKLKEKENQPFLAQQLITKILSREYLTEHIRQILYLFSTTLFDPLFLT